MGNSKAKLVDTYDMYTLA